MKKFTLFFIFFYFIFNIEGNAFSADFNTLKKNLEKEKLKKKELTKEKITDDWLKNKTVTDLEKLGFLYRTDRVTTTEDSVQYYLGKQMSDGYVRVICFVVPKKTICRLP